MTDHTTPSPHPASSQSRVAIGITVFTGLMMIASGSFQVVAGLVALFTDEFYVGTPTFLFQFDTTSWGVVHIVVGALVFAAGIGVMAARTWARTVGVLLAALSALTNFAFLPYYPVWAVLVIALDVAIIWALTVHGRDIAGG